MEIKFRMRRSDADGREEMQLSTASELPEGRESLSVLPIAEPKGGSNADNYLRGHHPQDSSLRDA